MSESHQGPSLKSYLSGRLVIPWLVIGMLLLVLAAGEPNAPLSIDPLLVLGVANLLLLWKILTTLQSISARLDAVETQATEPVEKP